MSAVLQRPLRGSRISTFYPVKNLPSLSSLDSAFQLQEYISLLIRLDVHDVEAITSLPGVPSTDKNDNKPKDGASEQEGGDAGSSSASAGDTSAGAAAAGDNKEAGGASDNKGRGSSGASAAEVTVDEACWIYEQIRRLAQDLSHPLITTLQQECTRSTCPEMKAGEWLYLCVAHGNDGSMEHCCAIDYILHTVDSATALLNSPRTFPSRLQIPPASHRHFSALARRLGRIFAHAYFHHREAFEQAEAESSLYARFLALTSKFDLVPAEFLVIPPTHASDDHHNPNDPPRNLVGGGVAERFGFGYPPPSGQQPAGLPSVGLPMTHGHTGSDDADYSRNIPHLHHRGGHPQGLPKGGAHHHHPHQQPHHQQHQSHPLATQHQPPPPLSRDVGGAPGGIGESPAPPGSRSRLGRNRTDTMVFNEEEAAIFAEQLRSPAGGSKGVDAPSATSASDSASTTTSSAAAGSDSDASLSKGVDAPVDGEETSVPTGATTTTAPGLTSAETISLPEQDAGALGPVEDMSLEGDDEDEDEDEDDDEEDDEDVIEPVDGEEEDVAGHAVHDSASAPAAVSEEHSESLDVAEKKEDSEPTPAEPAPEKEAVEETPAPTPSVPAAENAEVEVVAETKDDKPSEPSPSDSKVDSDTKEDVSSSISAPAEEEQPRAPEDLKKDSEDSSDHVVELSSGATVDPSDVPLPAAIEGELVQATSALNDGDVSISVGMTSVEEVEEFLKDDGFDDEEGDETGVKAGDVKEATKEGKKEVEA